MTYATQQDLIDRFGELELIQLTDRATPATGEIDADVVARALADADALIDSHVGKVYALPLPSVPASLTRVASSLARYYLHGSVAETDGPVHRLYKDDVRWLELIAKGLVKLDIAGAEPAAAGGGGVQVSDRPKQLSTKSLKGFI